MLAMCQGAIAGCSSMTSSPCVATEPEAAHGENGHVHGPDCRRLAAPLGKVLVEPAAGDEEVLTFRHV